MDPVQPVRPVRLEILSLVPTSYRQCSLCETLFHQSGAGKEAHEQIMREYPADLLEEHARLSAWVEKLSQRYGGQIEIRVIDPQSGLGLWKSLRHRVRKYPAFIVNGWWLTGWYMDALDAALEDALPGNLAPAGQPAGP